MQLTQTQDILELSLFTKVSYQKCYFRKFDILDHFNQNMEIIETQFRAGNISFLEPKETDIEASKSAPTSPSLDRPRHTRKQSVLTKGIKKVTQRSSK